MIETLAVIDAPHFYAGLVLWDDRVASGNVDEERRLLYVGLTRARESVHLSYCRKRKRAGQSIACEPSRFLAELAQDDLRWAGAKLPPEEAAREKRAGTERLAQLKAMLSAK